MKRTGFVAAALLSVTAAAHADNDAAADAMFEFEHVSCSGAENEIRIVIDGVKGAHGLITADLFPNREEGFLRGRGRIAQVKFAARAPQTKFCIIAPDAGQFAMSAYHDENANGHFDKNSLGLPAEPWGISNNPKIRLAPPKVDKALFEVTTEAGAQVRIKLR